MLAPLILLAFQHALSAGAPARGVTTRQLTRKVWLVQSEVDMPGFGRVPCNNLLLAGSGRSILFDALTTDELTNAVLDWAAEDLRCPVRDLIVTHAHDDRIGGIAAAHRRGIASHGLALTRSLALRSGRETPLKEIPKHGHLFLSDMRVESLFPGHGHAPDNLVLWLPSEKILYGGCIVKDAASRTIGNLADADLHSWEQAMLSLLRRYPKAEIVVPGHGAPGDLQLLNNTLSLIRAQKDRKAGL